MNAIVGLFYLELQRGDELRGFSIQQSLSNVRVMPRLSEVFASSGNDESNRNNIVQ